MNKSQMTAGWSWRDVRRVFWLGACLGVPLGWVMLPFVLGVLGATMEFRW